MKQLFMGILLVMALAVSSSPVHAAAKPIQIKIDGVVVASDAESEIKNKRTMVPLRMISESLGAQVEWSKQGIIITKKDTQIKLRPDSDSVTTNGKTLLLDAAPYIKNGRTMVPLRFFSETFGCGVDYKDAVAAVDCGALVIRDTEIETMRHEYHMTMGGVVRQMEGNALNAAIYDAFIEHKGGSVEAPADYSWMYTIDVLGSYYKAGQYDFLDADGNSVKQYDIYSLIKAFPAELLEGRPEVLLHDVTDNKWYLFSDKGKEIISEMIDTADHYGFLQVISNTVA
ncbi:copper amine oxidase N-terminal domain-containing protein [Paenibacillus nanensis]|uniref:Copper amine oxidase N-terminal domain-containing protein n=1 Tax=Paenibacillus nanensis TaxID=393251 RepID=A0A3A1UMT5_9BACL|nr:copper amine oxidase N-terminal domain-containing protein [Paenibacillus nanensis]RIX48759.1 copper amine oxidase N-terminal domain-containing protein [Paenibacillus nanensis]